MKKLIALFLVTSVALFTFSSCELSDDDRLNYNFEFIPVESVVLPESFVMGQPTEIKVYYKRPSDCHYFEGFYYEKDLNVRTIAIQSSVIVSDDCVPFDPETQEPTEATFDFVATSNGSYIFKFYIGKDANGQNLFSEYEVPVAE